MPDSMIHPTNCTSKDEILKEIDVSSTSIVQEDDDDISISSRSTSIVSNTSTGPNQEEDKGSFVSFLFAHKTALGVTAAATAIAIAAESRHRQSLRHQPPLIFAQCPPNDFHIRHMNPSMFIGTHNAVASTVAFLHPGPTNMPSAQFDEEHEMPHDAAIVHLHWYFPNEILKQEYLACRDRTNKTKLQTPVVLILHGINNHAAFGYMKNLAKTIVQDAAYIAVTVDFRGANSDSMRLYTASFTNDLRSIVHTLSQSVPNICLVGHSLGANIMVKYLGEQGDQSVIRAAVALANPSSIDSRNASAVYSPLLAFGLKGFVWKNRSAWWDMMRLDHSFRNRLKRLILTWSLAGFDAAGSLVMVRNDRENATRVGYANAEEYWTESSSYQYVPNIGTPLLQVYSRDDHLVAPANRRTLRYSLTNPNVMVVETPCGGHLGWQESNGRNYAADLTVEFFRSVLETPQSKL